MPELRPGIFTALFSEIAAAGQIKARTALEHIADAVERQAKINAGSGSHPYGTPTPASPGSGPAVVSGTLRRSITRGPIVFTGGGWETKVGTAGGQFPPYGGSRTPSSRYGMYLEMGMLRNGAAYPFLAPAAKFARTVVAPQVYATVFRSGWPRI
ncbi:hypothetical protein [Streptomyces sp. NPDC057910]|uniref:hypothetical protein n=1 Tax=Streptomyces sp. NPDC057910 TaxID=3346278 RepID=UPI001DC758E8|nr:hypothetical protein [Streptomyces sp. MAG02]